MFEAISETLTALSNINVGGFSLFTLFIVIPLVIFILAKFFKKD